MSDPLLLLKIEYIYCRLWPTSLNLKIDYLWLCTWAENQFDNMALYRSTSTTLQNNIISFGVVHISYNAKIRNFWLPPPLKHYITIANSTPKIVSSFIIITKRLKLFNWNFTNKSKITTKNISIVYKNFIIILNNSGLWNIELIKI